MHMFAKPLLKTPILWFLSQIFVPSPVERGLVTKRLVLPLLPRATIAVKCGHEHPISAGECIRQQVGTRNPKKLLVATQDCLEQGDQSLAHPPAEEKLLMQKKPEEIFSGWLRQVCVIDYVKIEASGSQSGLFARFFEKSWSKCEHTLLEYFGLAVIMWRTVCSRERRRNRVPTWARLLGRRGFFSRFCANFCVTPECLFLEHQNTEEKSARKSARIAAKSEQKSAHQKSAQKSAHRKSAQNCAQKSGQNLHAKICAPKVGLNIHSVSLEDGKNTKNICAKLVQKPNPNKKKILRIISRQFLDFRITQHGRVCVPELCSAAANYTEELLGN